MRILPCLAFLWGLTACALEPALELPFDFLHNQIVLQGTIDGRGPFSFVLDTGTRTSTIDVELARRLRLPLGPPVQGAGAGTGRATARPTVCHELRIGALVARDLPAAALDLSAIASELGRPLDGVLGFSFLNARILQVDYFRRRIRFYQGSPFEPSPPPDTARRAAFPMRFRADSILPVLEDCRVNATRVPVTIDTGSSLGLILFPRAIQLLGLQELAREGAPVNAAGYRGRARLTRGWARSVALAAIDLGAIEVTYVERGYGDDENPELRGGNLGNAVLQDFVLTLDYVNHVVVLEAGEAP